MAKTSGNTGGEKRAAKAKPAKQAKTRSVRHSGATRHQLKADAPEHKQMEEALRVSEEQYRFLLDNTSDFIARYNRNGLMIFGTDTSRRFYGYEPEEIINTVGFDRIHPEDRGKARDELNRVIEIGVEGRVEYRVKRKNSEYMWVEAAGRRVFNAAGEPEIIVVQRDITARKQAEEALQRQASLLELAHDAILVRDPRDEVTFWSRGAEATYGWAREEAVGRVTHELLRTRFPQPLAELMAEVNEKGQWEGELIHTRKNGQEVVVASRWAVQRDSAGRMVGILEINRDITERKQAEEAMRSLNDQLEQRIADRTRELTDTTVRLIELGQFKDQFVDRISHELRTPLATIGLHLSLLDKGQPEKRAHYLQVLRKKFTELGQKIEDLLDVAHISLERIELRPIAIDLNDMTHQLLTDRTDLVLKRQLHLQTNFAPDLPRVLADPVLLRQAVMNLLTNACQYTPPHGQITVSTTRCATDDGEWLTIEVRDTGPGLSEKDRAQLFEPFYRGEAAQNYKMAGMGVGLFIAQRAVEKMQGRLTVESTPGQGAAFVIWLKAEPIDAPDQPADSGNTGNHSAGLSDAV